MSKYYLKLPIQVGIICVFPIINGFSLNFVLHVTTKRQKGLGYIGILLRFESEIKISATRIRDTPL